MYGNFKLAKSSGLLKSSSVADNPKHFSDPPYMVIKPGYRAHHPLPTLNQLEMKNRYSFKPFGNPKFERMSQDVEKSPFRQTF